MIVALPPQVFFTHIHLNILIKEGDLDYTLKFIVGEGNGFNRLGDLSTLSPDCKKKAKKKAAVNKSREDKGTKTGSVSRVSNGDRWHQGGKQSPCWGWRCGTRTVLKRARNDQLRPDRNFSFSETELQRKVGLPGKTAGGQQRSERSPRRCGWLLSAGSLWAELLRKARRALTQTGNLVACVSTEQGWSFHFFRTPASQGR